MPIYEYEAKNSDKSCEHCRHPCDVLQAISDETLSICPQCGHPVIRLISAPRVGSSQSGFDDRAKTAGFSKLKRLGKGEYEKQY